MNTVNSEAQHSHFDFHFRFLLLHILAQDEKIELVLFQPILVEYPTRHSWIISANINLGTLNKPMHMFNRQKNIVCETISKLRNHSDDAIEPLNLSRLNWTPCTTYLWHTNQYFHPLGAYSRCSHHLTENPYLHQEGRNRVFYPSSVQH